MNKKRYFKVLLSHSAEALALLVDEEIQKGLGWEPFGAMIMSQDYGIQWRQPMIRKFIKRRKAEEMNVEEVK